MGGNIEMDCRACGSANTVGAPKRVLDYLLSLNRPLTVQSGSDFMVGTADPDLLRSLDQEADQTGQENYEDEEDDEDWALDMSPEAVTQRRKEFIGGIPGSSTQYF